MELLSFFTSAASGSLLGAIGGLVSKGLELYQQKQLAQIELEREKNKYEFEKYAMDKNVETLKLELDARAGEKLLEAEMVYDSNAVASLRAGYEHDKATYATGEKAKDSGWFIFVDFVRGVTRPFLTWGLSLVVVCLSAYLIYVLQDEIQTVAKVEGMSLLKEVVQTILFLAVTSVTYWFASRGHTTEKPKKKED